MQKRPYFYYIAFALLAVGVYFVNVEVQTWLGKKTLEDSGLTMYELDEALSLAKNEQKQVLAGLSAIWCPNCRGLDKQVFSNDDVKAAINSRFVFARIEYESEAGEAFMEKHGVKGFPRVMILDPQGEIIRMIDVSKKDPDHFIEQIGS